MSISENLQRINQKIRKFEIKYQREPHSVKLLAVSKTQSILKVQEALKSGQQCFGENYLQESLEKITALQNSRVEWHFIGPIQSNKTKKIAEHFDWVHSVCDFRIARRLNDHRLSSQPPLNICLEVNVSDESTKSGASVAEVDKLATDCLALPNLRLRGLMCIPAAHTEFAKQRAEFHKLRILFDKLRTQGILLDTLSMGMSNDYEAAIAEGSTLVRIGTAIFGNRG